MKNKGIIITSITFAFSLVLFFVLFDKFGFDQILEIVRRVRVWHIGAIIGISFIYFLLFNIRWQRILKLEGYHIPLKDLFMYRFAGSAVSYLTPAADIGGEPVMAYLLSEEKNIGFTKSFASVIAGRLVGLISSLSFLVIAFMYAIFFFVLPEDIKFIFYIVVALVIIAMISLYSLVIRRKNPLQTIMRTTGLDKLKFLPNKKRVQEFDSLLNSLFHHNPKELAIAVLLSVAATLTLIITFWVLALFLGLKLSFLDALTAQSIHSIFSSIVPVPANIGIGEAGESVWFGIVGVGAAGGFSFYLILRSNDIFYSLLGLGVLFFKGIWEAVVELAGPTFKISEAPLVNGTSKSKGAHTNETYEGTNKG